MKQDERNGIAIPISIASAIDKARTYVSRGPPLRMGSLSDDCRVPTAYACWDCGEDIDVGMLCAQSRKLKKLVAEIKR